MRNKLDAADVKNELTSADDIQICAYVALNVENFCFSWEAPPFESYPTVSHVQRKERG